MPHPKHAHTTVVIHTQHPDDDHSKADTHEIVDDAVKALEADGHKHVTAHVHHHDGTTHTIHGTHK